MLHVLKWCYTYVIELHIHQVMMVRMTHPLQVDGQMTKMLTSQLQLLNKLLTL